MGLEALRRARMEGKTRSLDFDEDKSNIYDEVAEHEYERRQRERLREDDFVVDDDGKGYVDNGEYEWDNPIGSDSDGEEMRSGNRKCVHDKPAQPDVAAMFRKQKKLKTAAVSAPKIDVDALVNSIGVKRTHRARMTASIARTSLGSASTSSFGSKFKFGSFQSTMSRTTNRSVSRDSMDTPTRQRVREAETHDQQMMERSMDQSMDDFANADELMLGQDIVKREVEVVMAEIKPEIDMNYVELAAPEEEIDSDEEAFVANFKRAQQPVEVMEIDDDVVPELPASEEVEGPLSDAPEDEVSLQTPQPTSDDSIGAYASATWNLVSEPDTAPAEPTEGVPESVRFFWTDFLEVKGGLVLFGKTANGAPVCIVLYNVHRSVYALPRPGKTTEDVQLELAKFFHEQGVSRLQSRVVKLRDVFSSDKSKREYVMCKAPYVQCPLPATGECYASLTGANSTRIENFLISKNIMGPCWLNVNVKGVGRNMAWTKATYECDSPAQITLDKTEKAADRAVPSLTLMSIAVTTIPNKKLEHELVSVTLRVFRNVDIGTHDATPLPATLITAIRPPAQGFPLHFKQAVKDHNAGRSKLGEHTVLETVQNERKLLDWFLNTVKSIDPDVYIGHNLTNVHLAAIMDRALAHNIRDWSQLGRFKQSIRPQSVKAFDVQRACSGRLMVDLRNTFGEEIAGTKCTEFSLEEMCREFLGVADRKPFDTNLASGNWLSRGNEGLIEVIRQCEFDTLYVASIALKNQMLPLSHQLTCLAGNPWRATLAGTRSGRNDYLLMHEFNKHGFLIPDKLQKQSGEKSIGGSYSGGHVFNPIVGLHQSCVLVMDFNSLYPSIIREYNICLTTVDFERDQKESPECPPACREQGLLPAILGNLVARRRDIKNLMKNTKNVTPAQLAEWNIRQTALKLTANSMYGCLGFTDSRFCAKPLAQLITQKGREALLRTRDLAVDKGLEVLYGDTDSVMVNTNVKTYAEAHKIGMEFKQAVNRQYKLMEIDIDHVFRKLILYLKKKYAAVIMDSQGNLTPEYKGLDMRRREFSDVCKISSAHVLRLLFGLDKNNKLTEDGDDEDNQFELFSRVYNYMHEFSGQLRSGKLVPAMFVMRNQLGKELNQYDALDKPQLVVAAARQAAGHSVRAKDVIKYIITKGDATPYAKRAVYPEELKQKGLTPDYEWYLQEQVFKPICRFCEKIEGFDSAQAAEMMELQNVKEIKQSLKAAADNAGRFTLYDGLELITLMSDDDRFATCERLKLEHNGHTFEFHGVAQLDLQNVVTEGLIHPETKEIVPFHSISQQVDQMLRRCIARYYHGSLECELCHSTTRSVGIYAPQRCQQPDCSGTVKWQFSGKDLYTQMCYIASLFDAHRATSKEARAVVSGRCAEGLHMVEGVVQRFIERSGYTYINIGQYFV